MAIAILLSALFLLSAFFSLSETSLIAANKIRIRHLMNQGNKSATIAYRLITKKLDKLIAAILIGNNFVNIAISTIVTGIFVERYGHKWGVIISTFSVTFFILIFAEITPKILAAARPSRISLVTAPVVEAIITILNPFVVVFIGISKFILRMFGVTITKRSPVLTEEEMLLMFEIGREEGVLTDDKRRMLHKIFEFGDTQIAAVMVPQEKIVCLDINLAPEKVLEVLTEEGHSRIPVFENTPDNIIGILYAQDLLHIWRNKELIVLRDLIHIPYFVEAAKKVSDLLKEFQQNKIQIAIVVDKSKKALGVVTLEDLIEEIVGEIEEKREFNHKNKRMG
ncbi:MAG: hemolysin family protein [Candidatus Omnitrophota bacterium]|nr:hemolysin family protein [Candidatus Omnitrophota bacterium]